jgi:CelD/BcsL family acetyltransferase involved in cellulose biosynthesis
MAPFAEIVSAARALQHVDPWRELGAHAKPNAFAEVEFVAPALRHFGGVRVVLVWTGPSRERLIAAAAVTPPPLRLGFARIWRHEQAALAALLVNRDAADAAVAGLRDALSTAFPFAAGLIAPRMTPDDAIARAVAAAGSVVAFNPFKRAAFDVAAPSVPNAKRRKEWARLERRLSERGRVETRVSPGGQAFERFLALEAAGWKGARGTALVQAPERAAFARAAAADFSRCGRLAVHELALEGATIAAGVLLRSGRRAFFWKIAFDETFAAYSPGVLLTLAIARQAAESREVDLIDSCAAPDHPMIDHLWTGRLDFVDLALPFGGSPLFDPWLAWERAAPQLREQAKQALLPMLGRKRS